MKLEIIATATFGLEAVVKREIEQLGYKIIGSEDGKITFLGDERAVVRSNLWLRTADRVMLKLGEFMALEFEDLYQQVKGLPWEEWIPQNGNFIVTGNSVKSKLFSVRTVQSVAEKAIIDRLSSVYGIEHFEKDGAEFKIRVTILKDRVTVAMDTSGPGLHKRGYRVCDVSAPIKETLASAMVQLSFWKAGRLLIDPCCGSGTIPIEAAMLGRNQAPGLTRHFTAEDWDWIPASLWKEERAAAYGAIDYDADIRIYASDIDKKAIAAAEENAAEAGVDDCITFKTLDAAQMARWLAAECPATGDTEGAIEPAGIVITNPPYGERIGDAAGIQKLYGGFAKFFASNPTWSLFMITSDKDAEEKVYGSLDEKGHRILFRKADRRRKLYNGRLEVCYYQYHGQRPQK